MSDSDIVRLRKMGLLSSERTALISGVGVDTSEIAPGADQQSRKRVRVLFASRLLKSKGIIEFMDAAEQISSRRNDVEFLIAGRPDGGNPDTVASETVRQWHEAGIGEWLGHVSDLRTVLRCVDIVALPTYYPEGLPTILLEGASAGCALVASDLPACRQLVEHRSNGVLVRPRDVQSLVDGIEQLIDNPSWRRKLGSVGRADVVRTFDVRAVNQRWVNFYEKLLLEA